MTRTDFISHLHAIGACDEALEWIDQTPGEPADLWAACQNYDWMIWFLERLGYDERVMRHIACDVAEDVLNIYEHEYPDDRRPRDAIAVARRYADGAATYDELIATRDAARDAALAAVRAAASYAADAAVWAADGDAIDYAAIEASRAAAYAAAGAAAWAADGDAASDAEWVAARAASSAAAWDVVWARQADMVRARVSWADVERAMTEFMARKGKE